MATCNKRFFTASGKERGGSLKVVMYRPTAKWPTILFLLLGLGVWPKIALSSEETLRFYADPILPSSQVEGNHGFFNLQLSPGEQETLTIQLTNTKDTAIDLHLSGHTAFTNVHGVVEYGEDAPEPDETLPYALDQLIEWPQHIRLAPNAQKNVDIQLSMPQEAFDGVLAGGIHIHEQSEADTASETEGIAITNQFAYVVGIVVRNTAMTVQPELTLIDVFPGQLNYRNVIQATIQNETPVFVNRLELEATVTRQGEDSPLYETMREDMQMAPNSHFHFPISLAGAPFKAGTYTLDLTARSGENEWTWQQDFTIDARQARALNREDVTLDQSTNWWKVLLLLLLLVWMLSYLRKVFRKVKRTS